MRERPRRRAMKVIVDEKKCRTAGICVKECPEVFRFSAGSKKAVAVMDEVPVELQPKCLRAALQCPEKAIIISK